MEEELPEFGDGGAERFETRRSAEWAKIKRKQVGELREALFKRRVAIDSNLAKLGGFRKYEDGFLRRREGQGRNRKYGKSSACESQTTTTKTARQVLA